MDEHATPHLSDVDGQPWCMCACVKCFVPGTGQPRGRGNCICPDCHCPHTKDGA